MLSDIPARESLISDIPAGDGKIANFFLQCILATFKNVSYKEARKVAGFYYTWGGGEGGGSPIKAAYSSRVINYAWAGARDRNVKVSRRKRREVH